jgi:hypothetical protein
MKRPLKDKRPFGPIFGEDSISISQIVRPQEIQKAKIQPTERRRVTIEPEGLEPEKQSFDDSAFYS